MARTGSGRVSTTILAAGNSVDDLLELATTALREPPGGEEEDEVPPIPYRETPHGLVWDKSTRDGSVPTRLTNFVARITGDVVEDDGAVQRRFFEIEAELNGRRSIFVVPAEQFSGMGWPAEHIGAGAILAPGFGMKDQARAAIQMLSGEVLRRYVYAQPAGERSAGGWGYLHAGGPIGRRADSGYRDSSRGRAAGRLFAAEPARRRGAERGRSGPRCGSWSWRLRRSPCPSWRRSSARPWARWCQLTFPCSSPAPRARTRPSSPP